MKERFIVVLDIESKEPHSKDDVACWAETCLPVGDASVEAVVYDSVGDFVDDWLEDKGPFEGKSS